MFRAMVKEVALNIPAVRRVFEQRDTALVGVERARTQAEDALRRLEQAERQLREAQDRVAHLSDQLSLPQVEAIPEHATAVFAHWGEDSIVEFVFSNITDGRYLDIGCFHPALYSNTMRLYRKGWTGVNVDPNPFMIEQCRAMRPRDISLNKAVGKEHGTIEYYCFHDWASSNTASRDFARVIAENQNLEMPVGRTVELVTMSELMEAHFSEHTPDFVNIDVEDLDVEVLHSGDWTRFRPKLVAIEDIGFRIEAPEESRIYQFLRKQGYLMFSRCVYTSFFIEEDFNGKSFQFR
ncbi:FkbM family methyltransferase [Caballeronia sp. Sq4a]|uniref:FkbM family methyltransferase n=1 Tax=Caballeronia sp. Sq4a TaxID=2878152 RepID=UPI0020BD7877|nr:FkbM family methyltransferase [Caballeronia sp. Sq4a]